MYTEEQTKQHRKKFKHNKIDHWKILHNKDYFTPTIQLYRDLNLVLVRDIYNLGIAKFVYKQSHIKQTDYQRSSTVFSL